MPKREVNTKFFHYHQNNSGGGWSKPAINVFIEALNVDDANRRAEEAGLYFDGVASGDDCGCCGDRWSSAWQEDGHESPKIYGESLEDWLVGDNHFWGEVVIPDAKVFYMDGKTKEYYGTKKAK